MASSIPAVLAGGVGLHVPVRVELTNGAVVLGRLVEMDAVTMNIKVDALTATAVQRTVRLSDDEIAAAQEAVFRTQPSESAPTHSQKHLTDLAPPAVQCIQSMVIRGACIKYLDYLPDDASGVNTVDDLIAAVSHIRPAE